MIKINQCVIECTFTIKYGKGEQNMNSPITKQFFQSRFLRTFEKDKLVVLFHQLHPEPVYLLKTAWQSITDSLTSGLLSNWMCNIVSELISRKLFIYDSNSDQRELEIARKRALQVLDRPTILYLMMAQGCNFACNYCPFAKRYGEELLLFDNAIAGITLWQKQIVEYLQDDNSYFLIFYGGEPLLNREVLERLLPYITKEQSIGRLPKNLELMLCTNGSLIDKPLAKMLAYHRVTVAIGEDGPQEHNDNVRITKDGSPTFNIIRDVIKQLVKNDVRVVASVIVTPMNIYHLAEYSKFLKDMGIAKFGFNLIKGEALVRALASSGISIEEYHRMAARGILSGLVDMEENGQCYEYQLEKKIIALRNGLPFSVDCTCYGNQMVIQADGQVTNCPFLRFDQGHVRELSDTFKIARTDVVKKWRHRLPLFDDLIMADNKNNLLDGGGCAWNSSELYGDITAQDTNNAIFTKEIIHELIWTLLSKQQANALLKRETTYWSYRRIGSL